MNSLSHFRMTGQRKVILRELARVHTHPTADEIYVLVRKMIPHISLGTVYRNLEMLSEMGLIRKLEFAGSQRRYDGNPELHHHIRCVACGSVDDVSPDAVSAFEFSRDMIPWRVLDYRVVFLGLCGECAKRNTGTRSSGMGNDP